uniref:Uncharacterized protein n=1 Tax=Oryza punctata TaxID=4537 RepID=A0A0E0LKZ8_ORYPU
MENTVAMGTPDAEYKISLASIHPALIAHASAHGTFWPDREKDELTLELQNASTQDEHVEKAWFWRYGFQEDIHTYKVT